MLEELKFYQKVSKWKGVILNRLSNSRIMKSKTIKWVNLRSVLEEQLVLMVLAPTWSEVQRELYFWTLPLETKLWPDNKICLYESRSYHLSSIDYYQRDLWIIQKYSVRVRKLEVESFDSISFRKNSTWFRNWKKFVLCRWSIDNN
jgi:hypothetical protein